MATGADSNPTIALGMYARHCADYAAWRHACIGCANLNTALMLDEPRNASCGSSAILRVRRTASLLSAEALQLRAQGTRVNWQKTAALFMLLLEVPAQWYVKVDTDALLNAPSLAHVLRSARDAGHDYVGKPMRLFSFRGRRLTYMQGGTYALSRRAALAGCACARRQPDWLACPNRLLVDVNNRKTAALMRTSCRSPSTTNREDLYLGMCMSDAGMVPHGHACFVSHPHAHAGGRGVQGCRCPASEHALKTRAALEATRRWLVGRCANAT